MSRSARDKYGFTPARQWRGPTGSLMGMELSTHMSRMGEEVADAPTPIGRS